MRLAHQQGFLSGRALNWCQRWASVYVMSLERWDSEDKRDDFLRRYLYNTNPRRYLDLYAPPLAEVMDEDGELEESIGPDEFARAESYMVDLDRKRSLTGGDVPVVEEQWV